MTVPGNLSWGPVVADLVAAPVAAALRTMPRAADVRAAEIEPEMADTAAFCERYGVDMADAANCVVIAGKRGGEVRYAACVVLATSRADVNGVVRRRLDVRKASFAPMADAVTLSGMEYGGITPIGLPDSWPILVDRAVVERGYVVIGSGLRRSKLAVPAGVLGALGGAEIIQALAATAD